MFARDCQLSEFSGANMFFIFAREQLPYKFFSGKSSLERENVAVTVLFVVTCGLLKFLSFLPSGNFGVLARRVSVLLGRQ